MYRKVFLRLMKYAFIPLLMIIIVDYCNIPSQLGIGIENINFDLFGIFFNAFIVVSLFIITYMLIDRRQLQKDENAKAVAYELMLISYKKCNDQLQLLDDQDILLKYIVPKIDFNKPDSEDIISINFQNAPFSEYTSLLQLAMNGILTGEELNKYNEVMRLYKSYVCLRITFFDIEQYTESEHLALKNRIRSDRNRLDNLLLQETERLQKTLDNASIQS